MVVVVVVCSVGRFALGVLGLTWPCMLVSLNAAFFHQVMHFSFFSFFFFLKILEIKCFELEYRKHKGHGSD